MNHVPEAPQSASGDYAWLGAEPGSVADQLYMSAADEWNQAINSRFVNELLDDTLPESILKSYLIQDFKFFNQGIMAHAIELAPRQETKDMLAKQSQWFADNEATYFTGFLKEYGITDEEYNNSEQTPANREYCEYLTKLVQGTWEELITALCCMEWIYLAWAKRTIDERVCWWENGPTDLEAPTQKRTSICVNEVWREVLDSTGKAPDRQQSKRIAAVLNSLPGWAPGKYPQRCGPYGMQRIWRRKSE